MKEKRLYHLVAEKLKQKVTDGTYPPGSRLPGERELAEQFDVSRVTIREAEIALQAQGYISIKTGSGAYVSDPEESPINGFPSISAFELTEARFMFESEAAALAARHVDDETLEHMQSLVDTMAPGNSKHESEKQNADREFHLAIAKASGNAAVKYIVETLWTVRRELPQVKEVHAAICAVEDPRERHQEHADVLQALKERDASAARRAMQEHFRALLECMIDITEEQALEELRKQSTESRQRFLYREPTSE